MAVPIFKIKDFFIISDRDKKILIEDIFYSKDVKDSRPNSPGITENFPVIRDRKRILKRIYNKILKKNREIFGRVDLDPRNTDQVHGLCTNKDCWESVPHHHIKTSTINAVYYLQVPQISNQFVGKVKFLVNEVWYDYQPEPNELIIFPNHLVHDTEYHSTDEWRISLNFEYICKNDIDWLAKSLRE